MRRTQWQWYHDPLWTTQYRTPSYSTDIRTESQSQIQGQCDPQTDWKMGEQGTERLRHLLPFWKLWRQGERQWIIFNGKKLLLPLICDCNLTQQTCLKVTTGTKALSRARAKSERGAWESLCFFKPLCQRTGGWEMWIFVLPVTEKKRETEEEVEYNDKMWQVWWYNEKNRKEMEEKWGNQ